MMPHGERVVLRSIGESGSTKAHVMPVPSQHVAENCKFTLLTDQKLDSGDDNGTIAVFLCSVAPPPSGASVLSFAMNMNIPTSSSAGSTRLAC